MKKQWKKLKKSIKYFNKTLKYIHKKTSYPYIFLFCDMIWCFIRFGINYNEYRIFEFYNVEYKKRSTYISQRKYKKIIFKLVDSDILSVITDKKLFNARFKDYIKRDIYNINDMSFKDFELFANENNNIIARSDNASYITSLKKYDISTYRSPAFALEDIKNNKLTLLEKSISQHKDLNDISDLVLINVVSVVHGNEIDAVTSSLKFKDGNKIITGLINVKTGKIEGHFKDDKGHNYKEVFDGFTIPYYDSIISAVNALAYELEEINQVEWTFAVGSKGKIYLLDAGVWTDYVFAQTPEFLKNNIGLMAYYKNVI